MGEGEWKKNTLAKDNLTALVVCLFCGLLLLLSLSKAASVIGGPIHILGEEHYDIGYEYYTEGSLSLYGVPSIFRAPGYPVFVALALHARDLFLGLTTQLGLEQGLGLILEDHNWIIFSQVLVLLLGGFIFYWCLRWWLPRLPAAILLIAYLVNPFTHSAVRTLTYTLLDFVIITILLFICCHILRSKQIKFGFLLLMSLMLGIGALIRPILLTSPLLIAGILFFVKDNTLKAAIKQASLVLILMLLVISPYLARNFLTTGRLIPISNQGTWALWGNSVTQLISPQTFFNEIWSPWGDLVWDPYGAKQFEDVTGSSYTINVLYQWSEDLSMHFGREFRQNVMRNPEIYLGNVVGNSIYYIFGPRLYSELLLWRLYTDIDAISERESTEPIKFSEANNRFSLFNFVATLLVIPALVYSAFRHSKIAIMSLLVIAYLTLNYSFVFLDHRYIYSLSPVIWFSLGIAPTYLVEISEKQNDPFILRGALVISLLALFFQTLPVISTLQY